MECRRRGSGEIGEIAIVLALVLALALARAATLRRHALVNVILPGVLPFL